MMIVADKSVQSLVLTGTGDVLEPEGGMMASARAATMRSPPPAR
jgi:ATP-dependent protease HslVU (ClpYQ) peptidase subunit